MKYLISLVVSIFITLSLFSQETINEMVSTPKEVSKYGLNNAKPRVIFHNSGTIISLEKYSFIDSVGNPVIGTVKLDIVEVINEDFINKIPEFDKKTDKVNLFEINATAGGVPVSLGKDKSINVEFSSANISNSNPVYYLENRSWKKVGKVVENKETTISPFSETHNEYPFEIPYTFDSLEFNERFENPSYARTQKVKSFDKKDKEVFPSFTFSSLKGLNDEIWFKIEGMDYEKYPEMILFQELCWVVSEKMTEDDFKNRFLKNKIFIDLRLDYDEAQKVFYAEFKSTNGVENLTCYPRYKNPKIALKTSQALYDLRCPEYTKKLKRSEETFDKTIKKDLVKYERTYAKLEVKAMKDLKKRMSPEEKQMRNDEWLRYYDLVKGNKKIEKLNSIKVSKLGTYSIIE